MQNAHEEQILVQHSISPSESTRSQSPGLNTTPPPMSSFQFPHGTSHPMAIIHFIMGLSYCDRRLQITGITGNELADQQAKLGAAEAQPNNTESSHPTLQSPPLPSNTSGWRRCTRLSLMSRSKRPLPRLNAPTWLASAVVITLLCNAGSTWWESLRKTSADWLTRKSILQINYGCGVRRFWWNKTIATLAIRWTNSSAFNVQL